MSLISLLPSIGQFYTLILIAFLCFFITYITTHHRTLNLMQLEIFDRKPFDCWLCSNFWLSVFMWINLSYFWTPLFMGWGLIITAMFTYSIWKG